MGKLSSLRLLARSLTINLEYASMNQIHDISIRVSDENPNHHLWNNNGIWWLHFTVYPTPFTAERVRRSLRTRSLDAARIRRDRYFAIIKRGLAKRLAEAS